MPHRCSGLMRGLRPLMRPYAPSFVALFQSPSFSHNPRGLRPLWTFVPKVSDPRWGLRPQTPVGASPQTPPGGPLKGPPGPPTIVPTSLLGRGQVPSPNPSPVMRGASPPQPPSDICSKCRSSCGQQVDLLRSIMVGHSANTSSNKFDLCCPRSLIFLFQKGRGAFGPSRLDRLSGRGAPSLPPPKEVSEGGSSLRRALTA